MVSLFSLFLQPFLSFQFLLQFCFQQEKFEIYGGLSKGWQSFIVDGDWLRLSRYKPPETWKIGATANFAIRKSEIFNGKINLFDESLGPVTPTGVGEDTLLFYRLLKSNNSIKYRADSVVKHEHRKSKKDLKNQIYNYSKGQICYLLITAKKENDKRAYFRILYLYYFWTKEILLNKSDRELSLIGLKGHLIGPFSLIKSKKQLKKINGKIYN